MASDCDSDEIDTECAKTCAACGKIDERLKRCTACKSVHYCDRACQASHRRAHKKACKKKEAELASVHEGRSAIEGGPKKNEEKGIFGWTPQPRPNCPICMYSLPLLDSHWMYMGCCGKIICQACIKKSAVSNIKREMKLLTEHRCPFCRTPIPMTNEATIEQLEVRIERHEDPEAMKTLNGHLGGVWGNANADAAKRCLELLERAAALGHPQSCACLGDLYLHGDKLVQKNYVRAEQLLLTATEGGDAFGRYLLSMLEKSRGNEAAAVRHLLIATAMGCTFSNTELLHFYKSGLVRKSDLEIALRSFQGAQHELDSHAREKWEKDNSSKSFCKEFEGMDVRELL